MKLTVRELIHVLDGELISGEPKAVATRAVVDSRIVEPGHLFFALKGERTDGHNYIGAVSRAGAAAVVVSHLDWITPSQSLQSAIIRVPDTLAALQKLAHHLRSHFQGPVVGITGSNGKTTTKQMTTSVMKRKGAGLATKGNFNSQIGLPLMLSELKESDGWMCLEMGASEPGNIAALCDVARPSIGVLTSIGPAHLKTFGSLPKIAASKWELMDALPSDGCAIAPWGEPLLEPHIRSFTKRLVFFGEDPSCPVRASGIEMRDRLSFRLHIGNDSGLVHLPVTGRFNVNNALASAAVGWVLGLPLNEIVAGLESFEPPKMRMELLPHPSGALFINDAYNANPASMLQSVRSLVEFTPEKKRVVVVGSMLELGDESEKLHFHAGADMGRFPLDKVFLYGDETNAMVEGATSAGAPEGRFERVGTIDEIVEKVRAFLAPQTVILFKGSRGMKLEQAIEGLMKRGTSNAL